MTLCGAAADVTTVRSLYMTTHELAKGLVHALHQQQAAVSASSPSVSQLQRPASAMSVSPMSAQVGCLHCPAVAGHNSWHY